MFENFSKKHNDESLEACVEGTFSVGKRHILTIKWVAEAWKKFKKCPDMIKHYSLKCGLSNNLDGTEDDQLKIRGTEDYTLPFALRETDPEDDEENGSESDFSEVDNDYSNDRIESGSELKSN